MPSTPLSVIAERGGLAATHELTADGFSRAALTRDLQGGRIVRVRQGWYAAATTPAVLLHAARVGGRLSCVSALDATGIWAATDGKLHVAADPNSCRLRSPHDSRRRRSPRDALVVHWRAHPGRSRLIVDPFRALEDACLCCSAEMLTASADSLLHQHPELRADYRLLMKRVPATHLAAFQRADGVCESGTETIFWLRMRHPTPRRQVVIRGVGRVDFVFGERLVVEVDGAEFHADVDHFESDRRRDARLSALGYRVLRFSYQQVMFDWRSVESAVRAAIARGDCY
ncbi:MAG TPA: DUF559 domain-containing protein [Pseudolysinimonas sp.]